MPAAGDTTPARPFQDSLDALHAGLSRRMIHEAERQTLMEQAGQDFHTLTGHPDSPAHHYHIDEPALERLAEEFREDTLRVHDRIQTDTDPTLPRTDDNELTAWLRHETRHENTFHHTLTTARTTPPPTPRPTTNNNPTSTPDNPRPTTDNNPTSTPDNPRPTTDNDPTTNTGTRPATDPARTPAPPLPTTSHPALPGPAHSTRPTTQPTTDQTTQPTTDRTTQRTADGTADGTADRTTDRTTQRTTDGTADGAADGTADQIAQPTTDRTTQRTTQRTTDGTADGTADQAADGTADGTADGAADGTAEPTTERTAEGTGQRPPRADARDTRRTGTADHTTGAAGDGTRQATATPSQDHPADHAAEDAYAVMAGTPTRTQSQAPHPTPSTRNNTTESGTTRTGTAESGTTRTGTAESGTTESGTTRNNTAESGTAESGTAESGTARTGTAESGTAESGTAESGTTRTGTAESGTTRTGTAESGTAESGTAESGTAESGTARTGTAESGTVTAAPAAPAAAAAPGAAQATAGRSRWRELAAASPLDASLLQVHVHGELHRLGHTVTGPLSAAVAQHYDDLGPAWDSQPVQRRATALAHLIATGTNPFPASRWQELTAHDPDRASRLRVLAAVELHRAQHPGMSRKTETFAHAYDHLADHWHTQPLADQATALAHKILTGTDLPLPGTTPGAPGRTRAADDRDAADRLERTVRAELAALGHPAHDLPPAPKLVLHYPLDPAWHTMSPGHQAEAVAQWIHTGLPPGPPTQTPTAPTQPATAPTPTPPATQTPTRTGTAGSPGTAPAHQDDRFLIEEVQREFRYLAPHPTKDLPTADAIREADRNLPKQPWPVTQRERGQHLAQILLTGEKTRLRGGADNTTTRPPTPAPAPGPALADATAPALTSEQREIYDKLHPALAPYLVRPAPDELGSSAVVVHALLQDRHPDGSLTQHAQRILLPLFEQVRDESLDGFQDYGVRVDQAISDRELRILHGEMGGTYPELASYLTRADTSRTTDANTPRSQYTVTRLPIAGTTLTLHHDPTEAPDAHAERVRLLQRAVHLVQQRGFTVPDLEVHLPKYTGHLTVAADKAIRQGASWRAGAAVFAPNTLIVASHLPAPLRRSAPDEKGVFENYHHRIGEQAVAILVHELGHVLHHLHAPAKDLDATWADFQDAAAELAGTVSKYAGKNQGEFVAEVFTGLVFGRAFTDEQANMYEALGGPTTHMNDISHLATPPDLGRLTDEVNTQLTRQPSVGQETVRTHYNQLTGDLKWAHHDHQASAITQAILHITTRTGTGAPTTAPAPAPIPDQRAAPEALALQAVFRSLPPDIREAVRPGEVWATYRTYQAQADAQTRPDDPSAPDTARRTAIDRTIAVLTGRHRPQTHALAAMLDTPHPPAHPPATTEETTTPPAPAPAPAPAPDQRAAPETLALQAVFRSLPPDIREAVRPGEVWATYLTYQAQADAQTRPDDPSAPDTARRTAIDRTIAVLTARHRPQTHTLTAMLDTPHPPAHPPAEPQNPHHPHPPHTPPAPHTTTSPEPDPTTTSDTPLPDRPTQPPPPLDEFTRPLSGLPPEFLALLDWPTGETEPSTTTPPAHPPAHPPAEPQNPHHPHPPHTPPAPHTTTSPEPDPTTTSDTPLPDRPTQPPPPPALDEFTRPLSGLPADFLALLDWPTGETEPSTRTPPAHPQPTTTTRDPGDNEGFLAYGRTGADVAYVADGRTSGDVADVADSRTGQDGAYGRTSGDGADSRTSADVADSRTGQDGAYGRTGGDSRTGQDGAYGRTGGDSRTGGDVADSRTSADVADSRTGQDGAYGRTGGDSRTGGDVADVAYGRTVAYGWTGGDVAYGPDETGDRMPAGMADQWGPPQDPGTEQTPPKVPQYVSDQAATHHLTVYPVPADGDCFFHALIAARDMQAPDGPPANTTDVRAALAETLQQQLRLHPQHPHLAPWMPAARTQVLTALADHAAHQAGHTQGTDAFTQYTNEFSQAHAETRPDQQDWQHVITSLLTPGQWDTVAGDLAPTLAAHHYNIRLHTLHIHPGHAPWTLTFGPENAPEHHLVRTTGNGPEHWMPAHPTTTTPALADAPAPAPDPALTPTPTPAPALADATTPALADATTPALADATAPHNNQPATHPTPPHTTTNTAHTTTHHKTRKHARPTRTPHQGPHTKTDPTFDQYMQAWEQWRKEAPAGQDRSRLLPPQSTSVPLHGPGAEVLPVNIGGWLNNLQRNGKGLTEGEANKLRTLGWTLEKVGEVNRSGVTLTRYKLKHTPDQHHHIYRPVEQYLQALDTWRAAHVKHKTGIPPFRDSAHVRGADGREQSVPIGIWLANLRRRGLTNWDSLLPDALRARGIPTKEENGHLRRMGTSGSVVPVWSVEVYLRGLATWRAAAPAGEDRSTAIPPDGTYITLTDPTPTPLTDASDTDWEHNATDNAATTNGADIPIGTWLFQARHQGLTGLTDHEITQLQAAGLHAAEPHPDDTTRRTRLYWNHPGTTTPTHTTSPRHTGTSHQPDTDQHPTPHTTTTTPAPPSRKRPRPADDAQTGEQPPGSNHGRRPKRGKGRPAAAPRGGRPPQTTPQGDTTTTTAAAAAAAAVAGQDRPAPPAPHAQPAPGLPATQPDTGTSTRPAPPMNTDTPAPPTDPSTSHHPGPPITDSSWPASGMGNAPTGPGMERPGSAVPAGMFDPLALDDPFLPGEPLTAAADPLAWPDGPDWPAWPAWPDGRGHSGESFLPGTAGTGGAAPHADRVGPDRPEDTGPAASTATGVVPMTDEPVQDLPDGQWWNPAEQERQHQSLPAMARVDSSVQQAAHQRGWTVWQVPPDGDCFFHALIAARDMQAPDGPPANTTDVRAALAETLQQQLRLHPQHPHLAPWMPAARTQVLTALADHAAHQAGHTQGTDAFTQYANEFSQAHAETRPDQQDWQHVITSLLTPGQWDTVAGDLAPPSPPTTTTSGSTPSTSTPATPPGSSPSAPKTHPNTTSSAQPATDPNTGCPPTPPPPPQH
ncbi:hypothetical protein OHB41_38645 [Streptomyces sp. NBC_01571]|uniref:hypothetical protein n=1 Tax=Streptomyces sp. NBC_01571 TaxID=2975883 RepID=UPI0022573AFF|nr:hypothetical protein [Streptomyces sp. NBC_01571]MCX4579006.1 hypothetical protein [Streptomyces sp. NBC_01571]